MRPDLVRLVDYLLIIGALIVMSAWSVVAAPLAQQAVITSPQPFSTVRGRVTIEGTAVHPNFLRYELYYSPEPARDDTWVFIGEAHTNQVANGFLGTWETGGLPDGVYSLRLRVVRQDYNYDEYIVRGLQVANAQPTETPTPIETPTPTMTPTPLPPTPTVVVIAPVIDMQTPEAVDTGTPEPAATPIALAGERTSQPAAVRALPALPEVLSPQGLARAFWSGARWTLIVFAAVGMLFGLKWLMGWVWKQLKVGRNHH
ncbi:MAG: hypothetical protein RML36_14050 [Anaerolineae bacterium]|nr:hypothetical protein [Anaerolineae bacterium]MDW8100598.1 hypothetical protein [Anaerolineae bacterium]